jgi:hypothetical protein
MTITPQSRIQVFNAPIAAPGVCFLCGSAGGSDNRKFIDFGKQIEWFGAVYLCTECLREASEAMGYIQKSIFERLYTEHRQLEIKHAQLQRHNEVISDALGSYVGVSSSDSVDSVIDTVPAISLPEPHVEHESKNVDSISEAREHPSVEGPDDLFDDADFE